MRVEIDRHILLEMIQNDQMIEKLEVKIDIMYNQIKDLLSKNRALRTYLVEEGGVKGE